ncbi:MAG: 4'-phosphopantetheinyl transferase superfamily protein [Patescibacteria group bacterium]
MKSLFYYSFFQIGLASCRQATANKVLQKLRTKYFFPEDNVGYCSRSYTRDRGIVVVGSSPVGVDIEFCKSRKITLSNISSAKEIELAKLDLSSTHDFYKMWCAKEACMKIDQSSFKFLDYNLDIVAKENEWVFARDNNLLKTYNFVIKDYVYSFAVKYVYGDFSPKFRKGSI